MTQPRIDLNHGYMRFIRRNQIDRDEFDRVTEQRKSEIRARLHKTRETTKVEPKQPVYVPPHMRKQKKDMQREAATVKAQPNTKTVEGGTVKETYLRSTQSENPEEGGINKEEKSTEVKVSASVLLPQSDSAFESKPCPILQKKRADEDTVRSQVRRRIERTHTTVDDICSFLAKYSLQDNEKHTDAKGGNALFELEITLQNGEKKTVDVPKNAQAARIAKTISREFNFDDSQCRNLRLFIEEQLEVRLARQSFAN